MVALVIKQVITKFTMFIVSHGQFLYLQKIQLHYIVTVAQTPHMKDPDHPIWELNPGPSSCEATTDLLYNFFFNNVIN